MNCINPEYALECNHIVWSEGANPDKTQRDKIINMTSRKNNCFFLPYVPNMLLPAAEKIFKIQYEKREKWKDKTIGFILGIIATIMTGLILYWVTK